MSWSVTKNEIPAAEAGDTIAKLHSEQGAYAHEPHRKVMDALTACVREAASLLPEGAKVNVSSYGHLNDNGSGNYGLTVTQG